MLNSIFAFIKKIIIFLNNLWELFWDFFHSGLSSLMGSDSNLLPKRVKGKIVFVNPDNTWEYRDAKNYDAVETRKRFNRRFFKKYILEECVKHPEVFINNIHIIDVSRINNTFGAAAVSKLIEDFLDNVVNFEIKQNKNNLNLSAEDLINLKFTIRKRKQIELSTYVDNSRNYEYNCMDSDYKYNSVMEDIAEFEGEKKMSSLLLTEDILNKKTDVK